MLVITEGSVDCAFTVTTVVNTGHEISARVSLE